MLMDTLSKERMNSMVGAAFGTAEEAQSAADAVRSEHELEEAALRLIEPDDAAMDRKLEPERRGIRGTLVRAHVVLGVLGLLIGLVIGLVLVGLEVQPFAASPMISVSIIAAFATIGGLLLGGLFSLRPDHDPVISRARKTADAGRWFLLVHTRGRDQRQRAARVLARFSDDTIQTI